MQIGRLATSPLVKSNWEKPVGLWLCASAGLLSGMVLVGGYTRLTGSGLSMTSWTFTGNSLPRGQQWLDEFEKYKLFPEYIRMHHGRMSLDEFKEIYFVEWFHRMLGRATGIFFVLPFAGLLAAGIVKRPLALRISGLAGLGLCQAFIGWWMVKSGLKQELLQDSGRPRVSSYRMCFHWLMALTLYGSTLWLSWALLLKRTSLPVAVLSKVRRAALPATGCAAATLVSGPFVAGNDAGRAYNSWPKMGDVWVPPEVSMMVSEPKRIFEDTAVVQFNHRMLAYSTVLSSIGFGLAAHALVPKGSGLLSIACKAVPALALMQMCLGITTLLMYVPTGLGVAHQGGGLAVFTGLLLVRFLTSH